MTHNDQARLLENLLNLLQQEEDGLEGWRAELPQEQEELRSLVVLARFLVELNPPGPSSRYIHTARMRIWNRLRSGSRRHERKKAAPRTFRLVWRRALAGGLLALALIFSGLGVASASALPGDALYDLKRGLETLQLSLAFSQDMQAQLMARFAGERIEEIEALSQEDRPDDLAWALDEYNQTVDRLVGLSTAQGEDWGENWSDIQNSLSNHAEVLEGVMEQVPESAQDAIQQAIERSNHGQAVLEILRQGGNPSELAPGQQNRPINGSNDQPNDQSNNGNAYGHNKDKDNDPNNRGNRGRGHSNGRGNGNAPENPNDGEEEDQAD